MDKGKLTTTQFTHLHMSKGARNPPLVSHHLVYFNLIYFDEVLSNW